MGAKEQEGRPGRLPKDRTPQLRPARKTLAQGAGQRVQPFLPAFPPSVGGRAQGECVCQVQSEVALIVGVTGATVAFGECGVEA